MAEERFFTRVSRLLTTVAGSLSILLGLSVLVGWYARDIILVQILPTYAPMQYNAALSFVLCGIGIISLRLGRPRLAAIVGAGVMILGLLTLLEYLLGVDFGFDQLFIRASIVVQTSHPGRMAPNTALCFALSGTALLIMSRTTRREHILLLTGPLGAVVLALGLVAFVGYLTGLKTYSWGYFSNMAVHSALGCAVLGGGIIALAWQMGTTELAAAPQQVAVLVGIGILTVTLCLWQALIAHEHALIERTIDVAKASVQNEINAQMKPRLLSLVRMGKHWEMWGPPSREIWEADAKLYIEQFPDVQAVAWVDPMFHARWVVPPEDNVVLQDLNLAFEDRRRSALELATGSRQVTATRILDMGQGDKRFHLYVPIVREATFEGLIVGIFEIERLFDTILGNVAMRYSLAVFEGDEEIYKRYHARRQHEREWGQETTLGVYGVTWRVRIWPSPALLSEELSPLPEVGLAAGLMTAGLLAIAVYLAQTARLRAVQVAAANQALHDEIHQHQRTESSLADRIEQMEAVRAVTAEIARELELTTLLHLITQRAVNLVEAARSGAVYLWDEPHAVLIPQAWYGRGEWMQDVRIGLGEGVVGAVAQRQTGCIIDDYHASPYEEYLVAEHPGATAIVAEPLLYRDRLVGVIVLDNWSTTQPFTEEDRELLTLFAGQAAVAIQNARLFADLQERTAHLGQLNVELHNQISERQQAEEQLQRQQEALFQSEKLAAMGSLLASVAHELNNPLSVVTMQAELLGDELTDKGMAERVRLITQSAERCVRIVQNFLALARQNPPQRTQVSLNAVVEEAMELLSYPLQVDDVDIIWQPADDLPPLWADPHQLHQVIVNLVTNAHQALRDTSTPRQLRLTTRSSAARTDVSLEVGDSGAGIPSSLQERIFEPFFTTKPPGVGTGLGLPFCKGIVEGHGGSISIQSQPGHGTVFRVELPVDALPAPATEVPAVETSPTTGGKAILVIDDEPGITSALAYLLRRDGHTVETAAHGRQALAQLQKGEYDLILCDLRMPELDGPGFYRELGQQYPQLLRRVIFLTGDTLSPEARGFLEQVGVPRLNKPFRAAEVRRIVQQALHGL